MKQGSFSLLLFGPGSLAHECRNCDIRRRLIHFFAGPCHPPDHSCVADRHGFVFDHHATEIYDIERIALSRENNIHETARSGGDALLLVTVVLTRPSFLFTTMAAVMIFFGEERF
jgi:hypothetical protein